AIKAGRDRTYVLPANRKVTRTSMPLPWSHREALKRAGKPPGLASTIPGRLLERSRRSPTFAPKHYHGPGGLNGRVRNGNGCGPAGMVAGKPAGGLSGHAGRDSAVVGHRHMVFTPHQRKWHVRKNQNQPSAICHLSFGSNR